MGAAVCYSCVSRTAGDKTGTSVGELAAVNAEPQQTLLKTHIHTDVSH